jgi:hypothetical protein
MNVERIASDPRELAVPPQSGCGVSGMGFFGAIKTAEIDVLIVVPDLRPPPAIGFCDALQRSAALCNSIENVLARRRLSQVSEAIIASVPVDMIEATSGPYAMDMQPNQPMREVSPVSNDDLPIASRNDCPGILSHHLGYPTLPPDQTAGVRVIGHQFPQSFCGQHRLFVGD